MASENDPVYCLCRMPYDETRFMIECDVCKDWFHGGCVGVQEHQAADIEIYHCPSCALKHGPLVLKHRRNWHRHDYSEDGSKLKTAVQTGTVVFIKELKNRSFPSAEEIPIKRLHGNQITPEYFDKEGFDVPILCEKKDGLGITLPSPSISIQEIEQLVGSMREIDVINVSRQDDIKMLMREWTEYYNSPNRDKILNVISLEFSGTKLSEFVEPPNIIRQVSWARNVWPEQLPEDCTLVRPEVQKYCLMGVKDSFTDFHIDFGGTSVWYHVLRGEKVFYLIRPTQSNLMLYERWLSSSNQSEMFFGDQVDNCYRMIVKQGHTLFIPTGWIHAVFTPIDTLVFGGNFLHNYNIPLQLQCYEIEKNVKTPEKYLFPSYETMNWYAAKSLVDILKDYTEEGKRPPEYLVEGARALSVSLKAWTQRKDLTSKYVYAKVSKQDTADYIQYGKVLKEIQKEVRKIDDTKKSSPKKSKNASPKKQDQRKKSGKSVKKVKGLDILDEHTKQSLHTEKATKEKVKTAVDKEQREKIYNFEDEDEDTSNTLSLKVRIPKAGAYVADAERDVKDKKDGLKKHSNSKSKGSKSRSESHKVKKKEVKEEVEEKKEVVKSEPSTPGKEIPQCLKFKLSNGKMVSTDKKKPKKKLNVKEFLLLGPETSKLSSPEQADVKEIKKEKPEKSTSSSKHKTKKKTDSEKSSKETKEQRSSSKSSKKLKDKVKEKRKKSPEEKKPKAKEKKSSKSVDHDSDTDSEKMVLVVDEKPKKSSSQKSTSATKPASLKRKLSSGPDGPAGDAEVDTIKGGLNGSISDILTASGYSGDGGTRDAIAGMLTMSRMGLSSSPGSQTKSSEGKENKVQAEIDEEEQLMADCYRDSEFVYPSFELSDEEGEPKYKSRKTSDKDDNWSPKARIQSVMVKSEREHRVGVQKESLSSTLANTAAKLAENLPSDKKLIKKGAKLKVPEKIELEEEPLPGPSTALDVPVNAFRPGIKRPVDPCASIAAANEAAKAAKKAKKGFATAKQRLGKLLKIKKMVY
ncbi:lysine-specific demethylase 7A-like isoform X1 [Biomphalaria glabrata]|uniref:Lysine-specific demethylase 7A-like isoform X1 n=1 Tax=Biomphalaria glabrata TaxID=6526 RepID=A0A9W3A6T4_BIOGL|nr:lysine-specific demethylase 7A-like isoform X1 [Biomphalaria glabrata]